MIVASFDVGEKNMAYVIGNEDRLIAMKRVNVKLKRAQTIAESCDLISRELASTDWSVCDRVLIEQQMKRNVRAQRVGQHIWTWFRLSYPSIGVVNVSPTLKTRNSLTVSYSQRKAWAVRETERLLKDDAVHLAYMASLPKRDDVADAYLQMITWIRRTGKA